MENVYELQIKAKALEAQIKTLVSKRMWRGVADLANELRFVDAKILDIQGQCVDDGLNDWPHKLSQWTSSI